MSLPTPAPEQAHTQGWQPISSAPKDGTRILFYDPTTTRLIYAGQWDAQFDLVGYEDNEDQDAIYEGAWTDYAVASFGFEEYAEYSPTHWMPLPELPT